MNLKEVKRLSDLKKGDTILLESGQFEIKTEKAKVCNIIFHTVEVITDDNETKFFNLMLYLQDESWVNKLNIVID